MRRKSNDSNKLKLRSSTRTIIIVFALVLFAFSSKYILGIFTEKDSKNIEKEIYKYTNIYNLDYNVFMKNNKFITEESLPKDKTYISDLIDSLDMKINYEYTGTKDSSINYNYKIDAIISANYSQSGENYEVWNKTYNLKEVNDQTAQKNIKIEEQIDLDYQKYNQEVKNFKQSLGMSVDACLYVRLTVNTNTKINNKEVINEYVSKFSITVGDKIATVAGENHEQKGESLRGYEIIQSSMNILEMIVNVLIMLVSLYLMYYIRFKTKKLYNVRNDFKLKLNRILKSCQDRIVIVQNKIELEQENTINVKDFGELIKLSEELYKPILYWISENNEEAWFSVISNKINYKYILKK